jgi:hypothetical protein
MKALLQDGLQVHVLAPPEKRLLINLVGDSSLAEELALLRGGLSAG